MNKYTYYQHLLYITGTSSTYASTQRGETKNTFFFSALSLVVTFPSLNTYITKSREQIVQWQLLSTNEQESVINSDGN